MKSFFGEGDVSDEAEYQDWLNEHEDGFVFSLNTSRRGLYTLHRSWCKSISYDKAKSGHDHGAQKVCFESVELAEKWAQDQNLNWQNDCPQCS